MKDDRQVFRVAIMPGGWLTVRAPVLNNCPLLTMHVEVVERS